MSSKKKDLEIICNLQWKSKTNNGGVRSMIVGVYDVPSTTLNWELFKSYLLKNSGIPGDDVKVSFLATNDKEFPIDSQMDFQVALYAFRKKARNGEIINLKLDRISEQHKSTKKTTSSDVQTQFDNDAGACAISPMSTLDTPPQWFTDYMSQFKKDIINEVSTTVSNYVSTIKNHGVQSYHSRKSKTESSKRTRKHPSCIFDVGNEKEFLKTLKLEKKVETKLEKLEGKSKKLKEKKMILLTKSSDSDAGQSSSKSNSDTVLGVDMSQLNAAPVRNQQSVIPHMMGGEIYLHTWDVINNGLLPWTSDTELHFTWGSACLEPVERIVPCPPLKPGESGSISVLLNVPNNCGQYESYWYFHHKGRKFGRWLGCQIIVDRINSAEPLANSFFDRYENLKTKYELDIPLFKNSGQLTVIVSKKDDSHATKKDTEIGKGTVETPKNEDKERGFEKTEGNAIFNSSSKCGVFRHIDFSMLDEKPETNPETRKMSDVEVKIESLRLAEATSSSENDEDAKCKPKEYIFVARSSLSHENSVEKEVVPTQTTEIENVVLDASPSKIQIVENFLNIESQQSNGNSFENVENNSNNLAQKLFDSAVESDDNNNTTDAQDSSSESIGKIDEDAASNSTLNDMVMVNFGDELEDHDTGYAYVMVDGAKIPIPKKYLRSDFLETAEDAPNPTKTEDEEVTSTENMASVDAEEVKETQSVADTLNKTEEVLNTQSTTSSDLNPLNGDSEAQFVSHGHVCYNSLTQEAAKINESVFDLPSYIAKDKSRTFVFPHNSPGYELFPKTEEEKKNYADHQGTRYAFATVGEQKNRYKDSNIYSREPSDVNVHHQRIFVNLPSFNSQYRENQPTYNAFSNQSYGYDENSFTFLPNYQQTPPDQRQLYRDHEEVAHEAEGRQSSGDASEKVMTPEPSPPLIQLNPPYSAKLPYFNANRSQSYGKFTGIPNYSQTILDRHRSLKEDEIVLRPVEPKTSTAEVKQEEVPSQKTPSAPSASGHVSSVVNGAMNMARNVMSLIVTPRIGNEPGRACIDGQWVEFNTNASYDANLQVLAEMGFWDTDLNIHLLNRYGNDLHKVIAILVQ